MYYMLSVLCFITYSFLVSKLFLTSLMSSLATGYYFISLLKLLVIFFLFYEFLVEWRVYLYPKRTILIGRLLTRRDSLVFLSVFGGTICSYYLNHSLSLGAVVASSLVGLVGGLLLPSLAIAIYCGSFAGMVSSLLASDPLSVIAIAFISSLFFVFGSETYKGFGGKLGATAYFATFITSIFFKTFSDTMTDTTISLRYDIFIVFIIGSLGTYYINDRYDISVVVASSLLGLTFGLIFPNIFDNGQSMAVALFCGTFIGMSSTSKLSTWISVMLASIIGTIIYLYTAPYFAGLGGKLGLIAFGSTISTAGLYNFRTSLSEYMKHTD